MAPRHLPEVQAAIKVVEQHAPRIAKVLKETPIVYAPLDAETSGQYRQTPTPHIVLNKHNRVELDSLAAVLVHEGTHALQHRLGELAPEIAPPSREVYNKYIKSEQAAWRVGARFWRKLYPYGKLPARSAEDHNQNESADAYDAGTLDHHIARGYTYNLMRRNQAA